MNDLEQRVAALEQMLQGLTDAVNEAEGKYNHDQDVEAWKGRHQDKLGKYEDTLKKLNGEDFDVYGASFDEYNDSFNDIEEDVYMAKLVEEIDTRLANIRAAVAEGDMESAAEEVEATQEAVDEVAAEMTDHVEEHDETEPTEESADAVQEVKDIDGEEESIEGSADTDMPDDEAMTAEEYQAMLDEDYEKYK